MKGNQSCTQCIFQVLSRGSKIDYIEVDSLYKDC